MYLSTLPNHADDLFFVGYPAYYTSFNIYLYCATEP